MSGSSVTEEKCTAASNKQPSVDIQEKKAPSVDFEEDSPNVAVYEVHDDKTGHDVFDSDDGKGIRRMNWKEGAVVAAKSQVGSKLGRPLSFPPQSWFTSARPLTIFSPLSSLSRYSGYSGNIWGSGFCTRSHLVGLTLFHRFALSGVHCQDSCALPSNSQCWRLWLHGWWSDWCGNLWLVLLHRVHSLCRFGSSVRDHLLVVSLRNETWRLTDFFCCVHSEL